MNSSVSKFGMEIDRTRIVTAVAVAVVVFVSSMGVLDRPSEKYLNSAIVQATAGYITGRALNRTVSTLQSTTVSFQFLGGAEMALGEVLDPINDLVEQYSTIMKISIGSLLIQEVIIEIISDTTVKILIALSGIIFVVCALIGNKYFFGVFGRIFASLVFIRFTFVFVLLSNSLLANAFFKEDREQDLDLIRGVSDEVAQEQSVGNLSEVEIEVLQRELVVSEVEIEELQNGIILLDERIISSEEEFYSAQEKVEEIENSVSITDRFFGNNAELEDAQEVRDTVRASLETLEEERNDLARLLEDAQSSVVTIENRLAGRPNSFLQRVQGEIEIFANSVSLERVRQMIEDAYESILRLMSVFVLETMILPLAFLYLFSKALRYVWGINLEAVRTQGITTKEVKA